MTHLASIRGGVLNDESPAGRLTTDQALYGFLVDSLTGYAVFAVSPTGEIISWNSGAYKTFGYTGAEIIGKSLELIFTPEDVIAQAAHDELTAALSGEQTQHDRWHVRKDGTRFWGTNTVEPFRDTDGTLLGFTKLVRDTTRSHLATQKLNDSEQQLRLLIDSVGDFAIISMDQSGAIKSWNPGAEQVFGYAANQTIGRNFSSLFSEEDVASGLPDTEMRRASMHGTASIERWLMRKDRTRFLADGKLTELKRDAAGGQRGFVCIIHDVTAQHAAGEELRRRAQYDDLTDVPNRRTFYEHVARAIGAMKRRSSNLYAVLFLDLDRFKAVNDEFGHLIADHLLAVTARRLEHCVRSEDIVARIGGDEFAILLNGINGIEDAYDAAERIGVKTRQTVCVDGREVRATVSIGIALGDVRYERPEHVLRDADIAMFSAKLEGRSRAVLYDPSAHAAGEYSDVALELRGALDRNELRVAYQPIVRLADRCLAGFETLVRWEHPKRGRLLPADFIPKAEESQLIVEIDRWILAEGCRQLAAWQARGIAHGIQISVNMSSKEFARAEFVDEVRATLESSGIAPAALRIEVTESLLMEQCSTTKASLAAVRALGIALDIDDFGTGFSSLGALQHMVVDALKIDASFVAEMKSHNGAQLLETVISLAHKLNSVVIAEGVENAAQAGRLSELGCEFAQGVFFAPPLDAENAGRLAAAGVLVSS